MDHVMGGGGSGEVTGLGEKPSRRGPNRPNGIYVIRFRNTHDGPQSQNFLRGYGFQGEGGVDFNWQTPGFGNAFKQALQEPVTTIGLIGFGESLARWDNCVQIDPNVVDVYGIPVLNIHMSNGENELALAKDMAESTGEMLEAAGARNIRLDSKPWTPGYATYEVGIARMGHDPRKSVLNQFQQTHDVKNLFVMDGSGFVSSACQNPTLTIMALCVRSCDYLMGELKRRNI
jgi:choline dehydrogenase-like flavoprotein